MTTVLARAYPRYAVQPEKAARDRALAALAKMPTTAGDGRPASVRTMTVFGRAPTGISIPLNRKTTQQAITTIPLEHLEPRQEFVPVQGLASYIARPRRDPPDVARVQMRDGTTRWLVQEGHTRLGAALLRGDEELDVRVWEFEQTDRGDFAPVVRGRERIGQRYRDRLKQMAAAFDLEVGPRGGCSHEEAGWRERCGEGGRERKNGTPERPSDSIDVATAEEGGVWYSIHFSDDPDRKFTRSRHAYFSPTAEFDDSNIQGEPGVLIRGTVTLKHPKVMEQEESSEVGYDPAKIAALKAQGYDGVVDRQGQEMIAFDPETAFQEESREDNLSRPASAGPFMRRESPEETAYRAKFVSINRDHPVVLYHGTQTKALAAIKQQGLKPAAGKGGDEYARVHRMDFGGQEASVFMTQWTETAANYGRLAASVNPGSKALTLQITIPKGQTSQIAYDPASDPEEGAWKIRGTIPPSWIKVVESANYGEEVQVRNLATTPQVVYAVVMVAPSVEMRGDTFDLSTFMLEVGPRGGCSHEEAGWRDRCGDERGSYYHGTSNEIAAQIRKEGLKPLSDIDPSSGITAGKGFASTREKVAISYAALAAGASMLAGEYDTITVIVFKPEAAKYFKPANKRAFGPPGSWPYAIGTEMSSTETVPPEMIQEIRQYRVSDVEEAFRPRGGKQYADWDTPLDGELEPVSVSLRRDAGQIYVAILTKSGVDLRSLSQTFRLPDITDVSFPSLIGAIPSKPRKKRRKSVTYKGVKLSRAPMQFEVDVLSLAEIPPRLDAAARELQNPVAPLVVVLSDVARFGAMEVLKELVRQGAPEEILATPPDCDASVNALTLRVETARTADLDGSLRTATTKVDQRRIPAHRKVELARELADRYAPGIVKRHAARAVNMAFALGRATAIDRYRRPHVPLHLASKQDQLASGSIWVDAVIHTAVMDTSTCEECEEVDGEVMELGDDRQEELHPPYVKCLGGDNCRCIHIALLSDGSEIDVDEVPEEAYEDDEDENF